MFGWSQDRLCADVPPKVDPDKQNMIENVGKFWAPFFVPLLVFNRFLSQIAIAGTLGPVPVMLSRKDIYMGFQ